MSDWRQSDKVIRELIAKEIWRYQEADETYGEFDGIDVDGDFMPSLVKKMCLDEAEGIRKVLMESTVLRERMRV